MNRPRPETRRSPGFARAVGGRPGRHLLAGELQLGVMLGHGTPADVKLVLRAEEGRVEQNEVTDGGARPTRGPGGGHVPSRVSYEYWRRQSLVSDKFLAIKHVRVVALDTSWST